MTTRPGKDDPSRASGTVPLRAIVHSASVLPERRLQTVDAIPPVMPEIGPA
jgi:hypothetical protein